MAQLKPSFLFPSTKVTFSGPVKCDFSHIHTMKLPYVNFSAGGKAFLCELPHHQNESILNLGGSNCELVGKRVAHRAEKFSSKIFCSSAIQMALVSEENLETSKARSGGVRGKLNKVVLAYSGGLDTSVIVPWLRENYDCEVVCFTADVGQGIGETEGLEAKAKASGASQFVIKDLKEEFVKDYIFPCLRAGAIYERKYLLGTSMARPVIAKAMVDVAREVGADAVAHGCTGKGNDQVRFELTFFALNPKLNVVAPWREWDIKGREDAIEYAKRHNVPVPVTKKSIYSRDRNLWHLSHEGDILEDPANEPQKDMYLMTQDPEKAPDQPDMEGEEAAASPRINVMGVSMVAPALPPQTHRMFLSNLDLLWLPVSSVRRVLFYRIPDQNEYSSMVEILKKSLSSVLVNFYPLAGRLVEGESGRVEIDCNSEGVGFIEASVNIPFEDLEKEGFQHKPYFTNLASTTKPLENRNYSTPLLSVQVTSFEGGRGICIGTSFHHALMDGRSFWHFMTAWAECSRGVPISNPPVHNRRLLQSENRSPLPLSFKPHVISNDRITGAQILKLMPDAPQSGQDRVASSFGHGDRRREAIAKWEHQNPQLKYSTFYFSEEAIRQLKQRTSAPTSFIALAAHFWRSVVKARQVPGEELVYFLLLADCRARARPPLPPTYFGNCVTNGIARTIAEKLLTEDASFAAQLIKEAIASCTEEDQIKKLLEWTESPVNHVNTLSEEVVRGYCTYVVGSTRLPVYEADHGWGKPLDSQLADILEIGGMDLGGGRSAERGVAVSTCLPSHMMDKFEQVILD